MISRPVRGTSGPPKDFPIGPFPNTFPPLRVDPSMRAGARHDASQTLESDAAGEGRFSMIPHLEIMIGDVREMLRELIARKVKVRTVVTSPPYWGLRDYGTEPQIWGGDLFHVHEWVSAGKRHRGGPQGTTGARATRDTTAHVQNWRCGEECTICGAWKGQLGLEPNPAMWVEHIVEIFRLVREVLAEDGTVWVNFGDCYVDRGRGPDLKSTLQGSRSNQTESRKVSHRAGFKGLASKNMIGQPWRAAFALQDDGWILRQDIIWHKPAPMPESCKDRFTKAHEYVFLLAKKKRYFFDRGAIQEPVSGTAHARGKGVNPKARTMPVVAGWANGNGTHSPVDHARPLKERGREEQGLATATKFGHGKGWRNKQNESFSGSVNELVPTRNRRDVLTVPPEPYKRAHYATFPSGLVRPFILAGSAPGDTTLDIFGGSGTVGQVSLEYGRNCILIDLDPRNQELMLERCNITPGLAL